MFDVTHAIIPYHVSETGLAIGLNKDYTVKTSKRTWCTLSEIPDDMPLIFQKYLSKDSPYVWIPVDEILNNTHVLPEHVWVALNDLQPEVCL